MAKELPDLNTIFPDVAAALGNLSNTLRPYYEKLGLELTLIELICLRSSQLNGCARCISVHVPKALKAGVPQRKIDILPAWREAGDLYTTQEKAALELTEQLVGLPKGRRNSAASEAALTFFTPEQLAAIEWCIIAIDANNRVSIASHHPPRNY